jgi:hypothetical protein
MPDTKNIRHFFSREIPAIIENCKLFCLKNPNESWDFFCFNFCCAKTSDVELVIRLFSLNLLQSLETLESGGLAMG